MTITFFVPGQPVAKGRPIAGRGFNGRTTLRTPEKTANYESLVKLACSQAMAGDGPLTEPLAIDLQVNVQIPASWPKKRQQAAEMGDIGATKKPDLDNIVKALCDGMNGIAYADDAQIVTLSARKVYSTTPGVHVVVRALGVEAA
ncbi:RusA family crossover junction endodeoxyribonuclease [Cupriavidus taiwanensis]|uniref:RusA family crossover junction endodeoxyribonuclease n=1 Tax=Cupriavidus taiwanensis TaxID=164546 RepID=UPI000E10741B|nr:RusA family crossover junction endodeoxyribonuclease [Cupriavidus taiwanensis]SOY56827.1 Endodeoxyribonuclease RusA [Cupriavidus taiwanensis]SOY90739.1 Endodeoxyribonuclease RusA [Cupriavidus taiwanensis]SOZ63534.1 Endodeoxyribonuclease RusA [Cupriavidus taiwanensis]SOZ82558.1 Endodeoxyribonuclease RusA [Cupriavidus taiwanensis]SOZ84419.1 Endodeoxyribonuclease RusA [Cupriavidus taiwanensis]